MNKLTFEQKLNLVNTRSISDDEAMDRALKWLKVFCPELKSFKRTSPDKMYLWDSMPCEADGNEAVIEYEKQKAPSYWVMPDSFGPDETTIYISDTKPQCDEYLLDFHVFPKNLAWCMSFTHEDGWIGPLFSRHPDYVKLNKKNHQAIEAKRRGYV
jgi:hypothetical protein